MQITAQFDQNLSSLPTGFVAAVNSVVTLFDTLFTNNVNVTIKVGFGEVDGQSLASGALGESLAFVSNESYTSVRNSLLAENAPGASTLPASAPANVPSSLLVTQAEAKALGLATNTGSVDGFVGFDAAANTFSYGNGAPPSGQFDFIATVEHEFSEVLGRLSGVDQSAITPMDLYRYSAPNTRQLGTTGNAYFSVEHGVTNLGNFNTLSSGDRGDWATSVGNDAFSAFENAGALETLSAADITLMNALGWSSSPPLQVTLSSDVFWLNGDGTLAAWTPTSGAQQVTIQGSPATPDASWSVAGIGDFDGRGKSEILWHNTSGALAVWSLNGSQITASQNLTFQGQLVSPDASWSIAGIGDFSGDGKSDILWRNTNGTLVDWTMNGSQITASESLTLGGAQVSPDPSWSIVGVGDFDGNGKSDILWRNTNGTLIDWTMNGSQVTSSQEVTLGGNAVRPDSSWNIVAIGDFNGDGKSDVLWRNTNGTLIDWTMNGSQVAASQAVTVSGMLATPDASWQIAEIGDFNNNGKSDILWRNSEGALAEWTLNGAQITSTQESTVQASLGTSWSSLAKPTDFA